MIKQRRIISYFNDSVGRKGSWMHPKSSIRSFHQRTIHQGHSNVSLFNLHCFAASFTELSGQFALFTVSLLEFSIVISVEAGLLIIRVPNFGGLLSQFELQFLIANLRNSNAIE